VLLSVSPRPWFAPLVQQAGVPAERLHGSITLIHKQPLCQCLS